MPAFRARTILLLAGAIVVAACGPAATPTPPSATAAPTPNAATAPIALSVVACTDSTKQLCEPAAAVTVWTEGALTVDFTASPGHCSSVIAHIAVDGGTPFVSQELPAGAATGPHDFGPVAPGAHRVTVQAEGVLGGCNGGGVANWSGSIVFGITSGAAPYPTPRLDAP
jgi:hypothetical protein